MEEKKLAIMTIVVGPVQTNCYVVHAEGETRALVFDPGDRGADIHAALAKEGLTAAAIFLTHGHFDHIMGVEALKKASDAAVYAPASERRFLTDPAVNHSSLYGRACIVEADRWLEDGEEVTEAGLTLRTLYTPGHTEGGCCYYFPAQHVLISGDTLFCESIGRTDLETGNYEALEASIRNRLYILPEDTRVYPGHDMPTTIGHEKKHNYFVKA